MKSIPEGLYIVHGGRIYFDAMKLVRSMSYAGLLAYNAGMVSDEKLAGFVAAIEPMQSILDACIKDAGLEV